MAGGAGGVDGGGVGGRGGAASGLEGVDPAVAVSEGVDAGALDGAGDVDEDLLGRDVGEIKLKRLGTAESIAQEEAAADQQGQGEEGDDEPAVALQDVLHLSGSGEVSTRRAC